MLTRYVMPRTQLVLPYLKLNEVFHRDQIDTWKNYFDQCDAEKIEAETGSGKGNKYGNVRKNSVKWIGHTNNPFENTIISELLNFSNQVNNDYFGFDLHGFSHMQWTCYEDPGDHYEWHEDAMAEPTPEGHRKLSFSLIFSDASEYNGGSLQFRKGNQIEDFSLNKGDCMVFPSWQTHRVTPVLEGKRYSLVWWVLGPKFR